MEFGSRRAQETEQLFGVLVPLILVALTLQVMYVLEIIWYSNFWYSCSRIS